MPTPEFKLAVMCDPNEEEPPSTFKTINYFSDLAKRRKVDVITGGYEELKNYDYDALFIRQTTYLEHNTFYLSQGAIKRGIPTIDDPDSIEACCNKLTMMIRFKYGNVPTPISKALRIDKNILSFDRIKCQLSEFKYPIILKDPETCFSRGVFKVSSDNELWETIIKLANKTNHIQIQEFVPTRFDWRVGVLDGRILYCCQYNMAPGHWQVVQHKNDGTRIDGDFLTIPPKLWPVDICALALRAATCVGNGLYGVDIKEVKGRGPLVIEVNDNPSIEHNEEDKYGNVFERIIENFRRRVDKSKKEKYLDKASQTFFKQNEDRIS